MRIPLLALLFVASAVSGQQAPSAAQDSPEPKLAFATAPQASARWYWETRPPARLERVPERRYFDLGPRRTRRGMVTLRWDLSEPRAFVPTLQMGGYDLFSARQPQMVRAAEPQPRPPLKKVLKRLILSNLQD